RIWYENPLNPVSLKSDFFSENGVLRVTPAGLLYEGRTRRVVIPAEHIRRVHFGGTRYTGTAPWLDVDWSGPDSSGVASFADSRPAQAVETYNRLFHALTRLTEGSTRGAAPETLRTAPDH